MNRYLLLLALLCVILTACKNNGGPFCDPADLPSVDCTADDALRTDLADDALKLAIRRFEDENLPQKDEVRITDPSWDRILDALVAVNKATAQHNCGEIDLIPDFRARSYPFTNEFSLTLDTTAAWVLEWRNGNLLTGNASVDSLIMEYGISMEEYIIRTWSEKARLVTAEHLNLNALVERFEAIPGVFYGGPNGYAGDGADIRLISYTDALITLEYSEGWGDCPSGCIHHRYYTFEVDDNCNVKYLGMRED